ncbi:MAG: RsmD family RNA methyltransferase [Actinomycetota bacterium]|nr:RsmD family RNA methyltransferase [Actinomycetota bacterium]
MRVVGGEARGRRFHAPPGWSTRPTSDRVREAIFGVLGSLPADGGRPVGIEEATVADLFAGSGAFGIEALSRGAARAVFVDADRQAVATIRDNLKGLGLAGPRATVVRADALRWLRAAAPMDLVLCDPPYAFGQWAELSSLLAPLLAPVAGVAVLESGAPLRLGPEWEVLREKHYGGTVVTVARPGPSPAQPRPER